MIIVKASKLKWITIIAIILQLDGNSVQDILLWGLDSYAVLRALSAIWDHIPFQIFRGCKNQHLHK